MAILREGGPPRTRSPVAMGTMGKGAEVPLTNVLDPTGRRALRGGRGGGPEGAWQGYDGPIIDLAIGRSLVMKDPALIVRVGRLGIVGGVAAVDLPL
jgi:hypothetical protein